MRNWTLTPAVILTLGSAMAGIVPANASLPAPTSQQEQVRRFSNRRHPEAIDLAGSVLAAHQIGPVDAHDLDAAFALTHLAGPRPQFLRAWLGETVDSDLALAVDLGSGRALVQLPLPPASHWAHSQLWLEVADEAGNRARGAWHLKVA